MVPASSASAASPASVRRLVRLSWLLAAIFFLILLSFAPRGDWIAYGILAAVVVGAQICVGIPRLVRTERYAAARLHTLRGAIAMTVVGLVGFGFSVLAAVPLWMAWVQIGRLVPKGWERPEGSSAPASADEPATSAAATAPTPTPAPELTTATAPTPTPAPAPPPVHADDPDDTPAPTDAPVPAPSPARRDPETNLVSPAEVPLLPDGDRHFYPSLGTRPSWAAADAVARVEEALRGPGTPAESNAESYFFDFGSADMTRIAAETAPAAGFRVAGRVAASLVQFGYSHAEAESSGEYGVAPTYMCRRSSWPEITPYPVGQFLFIHAFTHGRKRYPPSPITNALFVALEGRIGVPCAHVYSRTGFYATRDAGSDARSDAGWLLGELDRQVGPALMDLFARGDMVRLGSTVGRRNPQTVQLVDRYFLTTLFDPKAMGWLSNPQREPGPSMWTDPAANREAATKRRDRRKRVRSAPDQFCMALTPYRGVTLVALNYPVGATYDRKGHLLSTDLAMPTVTDILRRVSSVLRDPRATGGAAPDEWSSRHPYWTVVTDRAAFKSMLEEQWRSKQLRSGGSPKLRLPVLPFEWALAAVELATTRT